MSEEPPPKKLRQLSILDSFCKKTVITRTKSLPAPTSEKNKEAISSIKKPLEQNNCEVPLATGSLAESTDAVVLVEEDMADQDEIRHKCAAAAEKRSNKPNEGSKNPAATGQGPPRSLGDLTDKPSGGGWEKHSSPTTPASSVCSPTLDYIQTLFESEDFEDGLDMNMSQGSNSQDDECCWKGTPRTDLKSAPSCSPVLPVLKSSASHTVMFEVPIVAGLVPRPHPSVYHDKWDADHVKMPCSPENLYPVEKPRSQYAQAGKELKNRWDLIRDALLNKSITCSSDLEEAILTYNTRYSEKWDFRGLHAFLNEEISKAEASIFFQKVLPKMIHLALNVDKICTKPIPLLKKDHIHSLTMSQQQVASLLANAFFCTFPRRNARAKRSEYSAYPDINFSSLFMPSGRKIEKLKCIFNYFRRVTEQMPAGSITFTRQMLREFPQWRKSSATLTRLHVTSRGLIEEDGVGMLQVDFANKFIGGGVLTHGLVQEEIRFLLCPELIVSRLFTEVLDNHECLIITGCEQFNNYKGYADSFLWAGDHHDPIPRDIWQRKCTQLVAIDALVVKTYSTQFQESHVQRELNKAYCGFLAPGIAQQHLPAVATGNWGCGAFGGDSQLKALIQMMAAAEVGREVCYFTFGDCLLRDKMYEAHKLITNKNLQVSDLWALIQQYNKNVCSTSRQGRVKLFDYISKVNNTYEDTTEDESSNSSSIEARAERQGKKSPDYGADTP